MSNDCRVDRELSFFLSLFDRGDTTFVNRATAGWTESFLSFFLYSTGEIQHLLIARLQGGQRASVKPASL
jgi:hypothetical protein